MVASSSVGVSIIESRSTSGGRRFDGTSSGRPAAMSSMLWLPSCTSWAAMAAPPRCTSSTSRRSPGRNASELMATCRDP
jgi:hypothetical protein